MKKNELKFLEALEANKSINLKKARALQGQAENAQKQKYNKTVELSKYVAKAANWFDSPEGQLELETANVTWSKADFGLNVFGWQKSFFYKLVKVGNLDSKVITDFAKSESKQTVENLLKFNRGDVAPAKAKKEPPFQMTVFIKGEKQKLTLSGSNPEEYIITSKMSKANAIKALEMALAAVKDQMKED